MTTGLVGQNQIAPFTSPIPGGSLDATVVLGNDNSTVSSYDAHDNDSTIHFQSSTLADRPPASTAGQKWLTTDAAARYIYYDTGSAWVEVDYFRDSGGIITGAVTISDTTQSTSTTTGALIVSGGVGIAKNVFIGGTLGVTGVATFTAQPIVSSLTASKPVFTDASKGLVSTGTLDTTQGGTNLTTYTTGDILYASATNVLSKLAIGTSGQHLIVTAGVPAWSTDSALGTVTSVSWTGGLVSVATATTTPALTVAGTSGGIVYFSSASTWASSAALTQYGVVYGGGAGATPVATAAGTTGQVLTATTSGAPTWSATYAGTVTSVGFTGGLISVATATTTPALTVAGTSGGVVYFSSASTWASSAALTASAIVLGGGAGAAPATTTTGTGVVTALGVNVGTAGAFVVNGGALGTPSSGAVAASLVTAGTFGAGAYTFPGALAITGAFTGATTGAFSGQITSTVGSNGTVTYSSNATTGWLRHVLVNNSVNASVWGVEGSVAGQILTGSTAYDTVLYGTYGLSLAGSGTAVHLRLANNGAATFSSTVSMGGLTATATGTTLALQPASGTLATNLQFNNGSGTSVGRFGFIGTTSTSGVFYLVNDTATGSIHVAAAGGFVPDTNNAVTLGTAGLQWSDVRSVLGTFSSAVTAGGFTTAGIGSIAQVETATVKLSGASMVIKTMAGAVMTTWDSSSGSLTQTYAATFSSTVTAPTVYTTTVGATNRAMYVDSTGLLGYLSSIRAAKTNITPLTDTAWLDALTPVAFNYRKKDEDGAWTDEANTPLEYGLIAEEVEGVNPELVFYDETEDGLALRGVSYNKLMIPLLQRIQALTVRVAALEAV